MNNFYFIARFQIAFIVIFCNCLSNGGSAENFPEEDWRGKQANGLDFIYKTVKCLFSEVTLPSVEKIRAFGPYYFFKYLLKDTIDSVTAKLKSLDTIDIPRSSERSFVEDSLVECIAGRRKGNKEDALLEGRQYHKDDSYHKDSYHKNSYYKDSSLGFGLLGLKVLIAFLAFLIWELFFSNN